MTAPTVLRSRPVVGAPSWRGKLDPLVLLVGLLSLVTYVAHGFNGILSRDLALYAYAGQRVADGVPPYVGAVNRAGPLSHVIPGIGAVGARLVGIDDLLGMRLLYLLMAVGSVCLVYLLGRDLLDSPLAGLASAATFLTFYGYIDYASGGPREKTPMVLFLVWSLWALQRRRWFTSGVFLALATLVLQLAFPVGLFAALVTLPLVRRGHRVRSVVRFAVGGLLPLVVCVVYFAAVGALGTFIRAFVLINARYTTPSPITQNFVHKAASLRAAYGVSLVFMLVGLAVLLVMSLPALLPRNWHAHRAVSIAALGAGTAAGLVWTLRDYDSWPDAILVLPLAAVGVGLLAKVVSDRIPPRAATAMAVVGVLGATGIALHYSVAHRDDRLVLQRHNVAAKLGVLPKDATIMTYDAPQPLVLAGRTNTSRFLLFGSGMSQYIQDSWPGGLSGYARAVLRPEPTVIVLSSSDRAPTWMAPVLGRDYVRVGRAPGFTWYVNRSVGAKTVTEMRRAGNPAYS